MTKDENGIGYKIVIKETNSFRGIPYADYFNVNTEWVVVALPPASTQAASNTTPLPSSSRAAGSASCKATVFLDFQFHKSTWLQGTIESNTKAELIEVYELWVESAQESLRRALDRKLSTLSAANLNANITTGNLNADLTAADDGNDDMVAGELQLDVEMGGEEGEGGQLGGSGVATPSDHGSRAPSDGMSPGKFTRYCLFLFHFRLGYESLITCALFVY